jgi:hypothetical protein
MRLTILEFFSQKLNLYLEDHLEGGDENGK